MLDGDEVAHLDGVGQILFADRDLLVGIGDAPVKLGGGADQRELRGLAVLFGRLRFPVGGTGIGGQAPPKVDLIGDTEIGGKACAVGRAGADTTICRGELIEPRQTGLELRLLDAQGGGGKIVVTRQYVGHQPIERRVTEGRPPVGRLAGGRRVLTGMGERRRHRHLRRLIWR